MTLFSPSLRTLHCVLALAASTLVSGAQAQQGINVFWCGDLHPPGQYGPFDYRIIPSDVRRRVEDYHFSRDVEQLIRGINGALPGSDIDYTLRAFPNSPRALLSVSRYALQQKTERPRGLHFTTECYFERAIRFMPDDPMPHVLYANYLKERKRMGEIRVQLDAAEKLRGEPLNFDFDYNLGLLYFEIGAYDKSMNAAERAYALGAPLPALMRKLKGVKKWREPPPEAAASSAPPAVPADAPVAVPSPPPALEGPAPEKPQP